MTAMGLFGDKKDQTAVADPQTDKMDALKQKYQSVLNFIKQSGAQLENVHVENDKLLIRAEAPSEQVKMQIWDQIKLANPGWASELVADVKVRPGQGGPQGGATAPTRSYTVKSGDTLSKISQQYYGDANQYRRIFDANRGLLKDPDKIQPGQVLTIPD
jgi:nucleoid-associated protein YgaU